MKAMGPAATAPGQAVIEWSNSAGVLRLLCAADEPPRILELSLEGHGLVKPASAPLPLVELQLRGEGKDGTAGKRHVDGGAGTRLAYVTHSEAVVGTMRLLRVESIDPLTGLRVLTTIEA